MPPGRVEAAREAAEGGEMYVVAAAAEREREAAAAVVLGGWVEAVRVRAVVRRRRVVRGCIFLVVGWFIDWR